MMFPVIKHKSPYMEKTDVLGLAGKLALVTGGASGIGAGITEALACVGAHVIIADRNREAANAEADRLTAEGHKVSAIYLDLSDERSIAAGCDKVIADHGVPWLLVNNAGVQDRESFLEGTVQEWDRMHAVNARGPFLLTQNMAKAMVAQGRGGRIVNVASAALTGSIVRGLVAYTASKGALAGLSRATAFELAEYGITVNTVLPGGVPTPGAIAAKGPVPEGPARRAVPLGMCSADDIAGAVVYFASALASKVTNQTLAVDGGFSVT